MRFLRIYIAVIFFILYSCIANGEEGFRTEPFLYSFDEDSGKFRFEKTYKSPGNTDEARTRLEKILKQIAGTFNLLIHVEYTVYNDESSNDITGCLVNIVIKEESRLFTGEGHGSTIIKSVCLNVLQPNTLEWGIDFLILKINGSFASYLDTDISYPGVVTAINFNDEKIYDWSSYPGHLLK